jgi:hypothetical protein
MRLLPQPIFACFYNVGRRVAFLFVGRLTDHTKNIDGKRPQLNMVYIHGRPIREPPQNRVGFIQAFPPRAKIFRIENKSVSRMKTSHDRCKM